VVGVQHVVVVAQDVGRLAADAGQDPLRVEIVLGQDVGNGGSEDALRRPAMVVHAVQRLQGVAEGRVAHVVQQRRGAKEVVLGAEVRHQRENAQRVLQAAVCVLSAEPGAAAVVDEVQPSHRRAGQQGALDRPQLRAQSP
jgi:hypothetical protein